MILKPSSTFNGSFGFSTFSGGLTNATSCTGQLWVNGAVDGAVTVTVTNPSTGLYKLTGTLGAYSAGDEIELWAFPVYGGVAYPEKVWSATIDTKLASELQDLSQANVRTAVGLASANLDTQLGAIDDYLDTELAAVKAKTDNLPSDPADASDIAAAFAAVPGAVWSNGTRTLSTFGTLIADIWANATRTLSAATNITSTGGTTVPQTGDSYARLGAPAGASVSADIASNSTNISTILSRLGAITGSGINTVLGFFRALANKAAALTPTDLSSGGTFDNTADSLEAIRDRGDAAWTGTGGGTADWTAGEKEQIRSALGVDGTKTAATGGQLQDVKAKTDNLPADPAGVSNIPTAEQIEDQVLDSLASEHNTALTIGAKINAAGSSSDPMANTADAYVSPQLGALIGRLDVTDGVSPVIAVPAEPSDADICRVYGYIRNANNRPVANLSFTAELVPTTGDAKTDTGFSIERTKISFSTNKDGRIVDSLGNLYVDLIKTSVLEPNTTAWEYNFVCTALKLDVSVVVEDDLLDISDLIT